MEPEENTQETIPEKHVLHTVTPLSKYLAMVLFIALPFIGGWVGYNYAPEKVVEVERAVVKEILPQVENDGIREETEDLEFIDLEVGLSKDKTNVYLNGKLIHKNSDPDTFRLFDDSVYTVYVDRNNFYSFNSDYELEVDDDHGLDVDSLKSLDNPYNSRHYDYYTDINGVYIAHKYHNYWMDKIPDADPQTFIIKGECLGGRYYSIDKSNVYCQASILAGADPKTFQFLDLVLNDSPDQIPSWNGIAKDKYCIYHSGNKVLNESGQCLNPSLCTEETLISDPELCGF